LAVASLYPLLKKRSTTVECTGVVQGRITPRDAFIRRSCGLATCLQGKPDIRLDECMTLWGKPERVHVQNTVQLHISTWPSSECDWHSHC